MDKKGFDFRKLLVPIDGQCLVTLPSGADVINVTLDGENGISPTDFAIISRARVAASRANYAGEGTTTVWVREPYSYCATMVRASMKEVDYNAGNISRTAICPKFALRIPNEYLGIPATADEEETRPMFDFVLSTLQHETVGPVDRPGCYHTIKIGSYPKTIVDEKLAFTLDFEYLVDDGDLVGTGNSYTINSCSVGDSFTHMLCPEYEFNGERYVRVARSTPGPVVFSDGQDLGDRSMWFKVEPMTCRILNWDRLPTSINPYGTGEDTVIEVMTEQAVVASVPFSLINSPYESSVVRRFLNGDTALADLIEAPMDGGNFTISGGFINEALNQTREPISRFVFTTKDEAIGRYAFAFNRNIQVIEFSHSTRIGAKAFNDATFRYLYYDEAADKYIFSTEPLLNERYSDKCIDMVSLQECFLSATLTEVVDTVVESYDGFYQWNRLARKIKSNNMVIPLQFLSRADIPIEDVVKMDFRFFKNEVLPLLEDFTPDRVLAVYQFARFLGCFSDSRYVNKNGALTNILIAQKASSLLGKIVKINADILVGAVSDVSYSSKPSQDLLNFLSYEEGGELVNFELLCRLEATYSDIFKDVICNFSEVKSYKTYIDENHKPRNRTWEAAILAYYTKAKYKGVTKEFEDLATLFLSKNMSSGEFDEAKELFMIAKTKGVRRHILGKPLQEKTILESIEELQSQTDKALAESSQLLRAIYEKEFTFEFLDKADIKNPILGVYCSCCASIGSAFYGRNIARASVVADDVQNLVIRDGRGQIVAKAAMYVNEELGYIVFNDIEMNEKYKHHESGIGWYDQKYAAEEAQREKIYNAFMRGLKAFIREYNLQHPDCPIKRANMGMGFNRLQRQFDKFEVESDKLDIPLEYGFEDAREEQRIIYDIDRDEHFLDEDILEE